MAELVSVALVIVSYDSAFVSEGISSIMTAKTADAWIIRSLGI